MDQQLASYPLMRGYLKAYRKIFYLFDRTLFNAYILYKKVIHSFIQSVVCLMTGL
jgi:hypothetical protein